MGAEQPTSAVSRPAAGWGLMLVRVACVALIALQLASFVAVLPAYFTLADHPCPQNCALTVQEAQVLTSAGIAPSLYTFVLFLVVVLSVLLAATLAGLLLVRRSHDLMALITAYVVVVLPTTYVLNLAPTEVGFAQTTAFTVPPVFDLALSSLQSAAILGLFLLFPNGRFVPRHAWMLLVGFVAFTSIFASLPADAESPLLVLWPLFFLAVVACIGYRYWRVSTPLERQQTKWVIFGFVTFLATSLIYWLPTFTSLANTIYLPLSYLAYEMLLPALPLTIFIAVQRYRLYDIDVLIRRTLVYGSLTVVVVAIYGVGVLGTQLVLQAVGGHAIGESPPAIVVTTLLVAALFQPLRRRIQNEIDRRFYRSRYDAERTLAAFGVALRSDVDLDHLCAHFAGVVEDTMQPTHLTLWLRHGEQSHAANMRGFDVETHAITARGES